MAYDDWGRLLSDHFPHRDRSAVQPDWESLKKQLKVGDIVTGTVIAKAPFGAWLDIGVGFPALLEIPFIDGLTPERCRADDWCPINSSISAFVSGFNDHNFQVGLRQVKREPN